MGNLRLITAASLAVFASAEGFAVYMHDWAPLCPFPYQLCEPMQKPFLETGRGTLVNSIGLGASPNTAVEVVSQAVSTGNTGGRWNLI